MAYNDEIHIPQDRRDDASMARIGRKALAAIQQVIREEAGVSPRDTRPVCLGCSSIVAEAANEAAEREWTDRDRNPVLVEAFLRGLLREEVRV